MSETAFPTCENCKGSGKSFAICVLRSDGRGGPAEISCPTCHGTGVDRTDPKWREYGRELRRWRVGMDRSLGEEAARRGLRVVELSDMEHGRREPEWPIDSAPDSPAEGKGRGTR